MKNIFTLILCLFAVVCSGDLIAQNDCASAVPIALTPGCIGSDNNATLIPAASLTASAPVGHCYGNVGNDVWYTWTATSTGLQFSDGTGGPGLAVFDASTVNCADLSTAVDYNCSGTFFGGDVTGWAVGDNLLIHIYDFAGSTSDVGFCIQEANLGCTDVNAQNYDPNATVDDGSCYTEVNNVCSGAIAAPFTIDMSSCDMASNLDFTPFVDAGFDATCETGTTDHFAFFTWTAPVIGLPGDPLNVAFDDGDSFANGCNLGVEFYAADCSAPVGPCLFGTGTVTNLVQGDSYVIALWDDTTTPPATGCDFCLETLPPPPPEDDCATPIAYPGAVDFTSCDLGNEVMAVDFAQYFDNGFDASCETGTTDHFAFFSWTAPVITAAGDALDLNWDDGDSFTNGCNLGIEFYEVGCTAPVSNCLFGSGTVNGLVQGDTYTIAIWDDTATPPADGCDFCLSVICSAPTAIASAICVPGDDSGFYVELDVTSLGVGNTAHTLDIAGAQANVTAIGITTYGPFPAGTPVDVVLTGVDDATCGLTISGLDKACNIVDGIADGDVFCDGDTAVTVTPNIPATPGVTGILTAEGTFDTEIGLGLYLGTWDDGSVIGLPPAGTGLFGTDTETSLEGSTPGANNINTVGNFGNPALIGNSFTSAPLMDGMTYTLFIIDDFGDGWNGNDADLVDCEGNVIVPGLATFIDAIAADPQDEVAWTTFTYTEPATTVTWSGPGAVTTDPDGMPASGDEVYTFDPSMAGAACAPATSTLSMEVLVCGLTCTETLDVIVYPSLTTNIVDDGATCGTPTVELVAPDGTVCETETGPACVDDGDTFTTDFAATATGTALAAAPAACPVPEETVTCAGCVIPCPAPLVVDACCNAYTQPVFVDPVFDVCALGGATLGGAYTVSFPAGCDVDVIIHAANDPNVPDTRLQLYDAGPSPAADCNNLVCVASDDDGGPGFTSQLAATLTGGNDYVIEWDDRWSNTGFDWEIVVVHEITTPASGLQEGCPGDTPDLTDATTGLVVTTPTCITNLNSSVVWTLGGVPLADLSNVIDPTNPALFPATTGCVPVEYVLEAYEGCAPIFQPAGSVTFSVTDCAPLIAGLPTEACATDAPVVLTSNQPLSTFELSVTAVTGGFGDENAFGIFADDGTGNPDYTTPLFQLNGTEGADFAAANYCNNTSYGGPGVGSLNPSNPLADPLILASTPAPGDVIFIELRDGWGDGWNGATFELVDGCGSVIATEADVEGDGCGAIVPYTVPVQSIVFSGPGVTNTSDPDGVPNNNDDVWEFDPSVAADNCGLATATVTLTITDCGTVCIEDIDVPVYPTLSTNIVDDGTTCGTPTVELLGTDGTTVCETETGAACAADGDTFTTDFAATATGMALAMAPAACPVPEETVTCAGCTSTCGAQAPVVTANMITCADGSMVPDGTLTDDGTSATAPFITEYIVTNGPGGEIVSVHGTLAAAEAAAQAEADAPTDPDGDLTEDACVVAISHDPAGIPIFVNELDPELQACLGLPFSVCVLLGAPCPNYVSLEELYTALQGVGLNETVAGVELLLSGDLSALGCPAFTPTPFCYNVSVEACFTNAECPPTVCTPAATCPTLAGTTVIGIADGDVFCEGDAALALTGTTDGAFETSFQLVGVNAIWGAEIEITIVDGNGVTTVIPQGTLSNTGAPDPTQVLLASLCTSDGPFTVTAIDAAFCGDSSTDIEIYDENCGAWIADADPANGTPIIVFSDPAAWADPTDPFLNGGAPGCSIPVTIPLPTPGVPLFSGTGVTDAGDGTAGTFDPTGLGDVCGTAVAVEYTATVNDPTTCTDCSQTVTANVNVYAPPALGVDFTEPTVLCGGDPIVDLGNCTPDALTILYDDGAGGPIANTTPPPALATGDPDMTISYTVLNPNAPPGCEATGSYVVSCPVVGTCPTDAGTMITGTIAAGDVFCSTDAAVGLTGVNDNGLLGPDLQVVTLNHVWAEEMELEILDATGAVVQAFPAGSFPGGASVPAQTLLTTLPGAGGPYSISSLDANFCGDSSMTVELYDAACAPWVADGDPTNGTPLATADILPDPNDPANPGGGGVSCTIPVVVAVTTGQYVFSGDGVTDGGDGATGTFDPAATTADACGTLTTITYDINIIDPLTCVECPEGTATMDVTVYAAPQAGVDFIVPSNFCGGLPITTNCPDLVVLYDDGAGGPVTNTSPPAASMSGDPAITVNYEISNPNAPPGCGTVGDYTYTCPPLTCPGFDSDNADVTQTCDGGSGNFSVSLTDPMGPILTPQIDNVSVTGSNNDLVVGTNVNPAGDATNGACNISFSSDDVNAETVTFTTTPSNTTGAAGQLDLIYNFQDFAGNGDFLVEFWDGAAYQPIFCETDDDTGVNWTGASPVSIDLADPFVELTDCALTLGGVTTGQGTGVSFLNVTDFHIRVTFTTDGTNQGHGFSMDDISVTVDGGQAYFEDFETCDIVPANSTVSVTWTDPSGGTTTTNGLDWDDATGAYDFAWTFAHSGTSFCAAETQTVAYELICDTDGSIIATGSFDVDVYPPLPTSAADLVTITIDPANGCIADIVYAPGCDATSVIVTEVTAPVDGTAGTASYTIDYGAGPCCPTGISELASGALDDDVNGGACSGQGAEDLYPFVFSASSALVVTDTGGAGVGDLTQVCVDVTVAIGPSGNDDDGIAIVLMDTATGLEVPIFVGSVYSNAGIFPAPATSGPGTTDTAIVGCFTTDNAGTPLSTLLAGSNYADLALKIYEADCAFGDPIPSGSILNSSTLEYVEDLALCSFAEDVAYDCTAPPCIDPTVACYTQDWDAATSSTSCTAAPLDPLGDGSWINNSPTGNTWAADSGGTGSGGTGPEFDNTGTLFGCPEGDPAGVTNGLGQYMYAETSAACNGGDDEFVLESAECFDLSNATACTNISFWTHAFGADIGDFNFEYTIDGGVTWTSLYNQSGPVQTSDTDPWTPVNINVLANGLNNANVQFRFHYLSGPGFTGDFAFDDFSICDDLALAIAATDKTVCDAATTTMALNDGISTLDAGFPGATYVWSTGETTQTIDVVAGIYDVTVTTADGCTGMASFEVCEEVCPCTDPTVSAATSCVVGDNGNFYVDVTFTDIGGLNASGYTVDVAGPQTDVTAAGTYTYGPFPSGTPVDVIITGIDDATCGFTATGLDRNCDCGTTPDITGLADGDAFCEGDPIVTVTPGNILEDLSVTAILTAEGAFDGEIGLGLYQGTWDDGTALGLPPAGTGLFGTDTETSLEGAIPNDGAGNPNVTTAGNFGTTAFVGNSFSSTPLMNGMTYTLFIIDDFGDGWNGNDADLIDCNGTVILSNLAQYIDAIGGDVQDEVAWVTFTYVAPSPSIVWSGTGAVTTDPDGIPDSGDEVYTFDPSALTVAACGSTPTTLTLSVTSCGLTCEESIDVSVNAIPVLDTDFTLPTADCDNTIVDVCGGLTILYDDGMGGPVTNTAPPVINPGDPDMTVNYSVQNSNAANCAATGSFVSTCPSVATCPTCAACEKPNELTITSEMPFNGGTSFSDANGAILGVGGNDSFAGYQWDLDAAEICNMQLDQFCMFADFTITGDPADFPINVEFRIENNVPGGFPNPWTHFDQTISAPGTYTFGGNLATGSPNFNGVPFDITCPDPASNPALVVAIANFGAAPFAADMVLTWDNVFITDGTCVPFDASVISTADPTTICIDGTPDPIDVTVDVAGDGPSNAWVITDANGIILALPPGPPFDLDGAGAGTCLIWQVNYDDPAFAPMVGDDAAAIVAASSCANLSNPITVVRNEATAATISTMDPTTICVDGIGDPINVTFDNAGTGDSGAWVITDAAGIILDLPAGPPFDLDGAGAGTCLIWWVNYSDANFAPVVGDDATALVAASCAALSNPITVDRFDPPTVDAGTYGPICMQDGAITLTGSPADAGGVWSGTNVTDNGDGTASFDPMMLAGQLITVTYDYTDANGCTGQATTDIQVDDCSGPTCPTCGVCESPTELPIIADGAFSGGGGAFDDGTQMFIPQGTATFVGHEWNVDPTAFTSTDPATYCVFGTFEVIADPADLPITLELRIENNAGFPSNWTDFNMSVSAPGVYTLGGNLSTGTTGPTGIPFDPAGVTPNLVVAINAAANNADIQVLYQDVFVTDGTCSPITADTGSYGPICMQDGPITLTGSPTPGTWSGTNVTDNGDGTATFDPMMLAGQVITVSYAYDDGMGCMDTATTDIQVDDCAPTACTVSAGTCNACATCDESFTADLTSGTIFNDSGEFGGSGIPAVDPTYDPVTNTGTWTMPAGIINAFAAGGVSGLTLPDVVNDVCFTADINVVSGTTPFLIEFRIENGTGAPANGGQALTYNVMADGTGACSMGGSFADGTVENGFAFVPGQTYAVVVALADFSGAPVPSDVVVDISNILLSVCTPASPTINDNPVDVCASDAGAVDLTTYEPVAGGAWTDGTGAAVADATMADANNGPYTYDYADMDGCPAQETVSYTVNPNPAPTITGIDMICTTGTGTIGDGSDEQTTLDAGSGFVSYLWSDGSTNQTFVATSAGTYDVTVTDANGCEGTASLVVTSMNCTIPTIDDETSINDPCDCASPGNIDLNGDGFFDIIDDVVTVTGPPGDTWTLTMNGTPPVLDASGNPLPTNGTITMTEVSPGVYEFTVYYLPDGSGFGLIEFTSTNVVGPQGVLQLTNTASGPGQGNACNCIQCPTYVDSSCTASEICETGDVMLTLTTDCGPIPPGMGTITYTIDTDGDGSIDITTTDTYTSCDDITQTVTLTHSGVGCDAEVQTINWDLTCPANGTSIGGGSTSVTVYPTLSVSANNTTDCSAPMVQVTGPDGSVCDMMMGTVAPMPSCTELTTQAQTAYEFSYFDGSICEQYFAGVLTSDCTGTCDCPSGATAAATIENVCGDSSPTLPIDAALGIDLPTNAVVTWSPDPSAAVVSDCVLRTVVYTPTISCLDDCSVSFAGPTHTLNVYPDPADFAGAIGVDGGCGTDPYLDLSATNCLPVVSGPVVIDATVDGCAADNMPTPDDGEYEYTLALPNIAGAPPCYVFPGDEDLIVIDVACTNNCMVTTDYCNINVACIDVSDCDPVTGTYDATATIVYSVSSADQIDVTLDGANTQSVTPTIVGSLATATVTFSGLTSDAQTHIIAATLVDNTNGICNSSANLSYDAPADCTDCAVPNAGTPVGP